MGSDRFYREERPARRETVQGFWLEDIPDPRRVSNSCAPPVTSRPASVRPIPLCIPPPDPALFVPGSRYFASRAARWTCATTAPWPGRSPGADWRHPQGPAAASTAGMITPLFQTIRLRGVRAATRPGPGKNCRTNPSGNSGPRRSRRRDLRRGEAFAPQGRAMADTWQGRFPWGDSSSTATMAPLQSMPFPRTAMGFTT